VQPLGLSIRAVYTANVGTFVPVKSQPSKILENAGFRLARGALGIGVLDAQNEGAILAVSKEPVEERGPRVSNMQLPGRTWCESDAHQ
jgi:hypothetical protein